MLCASISEFASITSCCRESSFPHSVNEYVKRGTLSRNADWSQNGTFMRVVAAERHKSTSVTSFEYRPSGRHLVGREARPYRSTSMPLAEIDAETN